MKRALALVVAFAPLVACNAIFGIDPYETYVDQDGSVGPEAGADGKADGIAPDAADASDAAALTCDGSDLVGCACSGSPNICYRYPPFDGGLATACSPGLQQCVGSTYGACMGGGCKCNTDFDLCKGLTGDAGTLNGGVYNLFVDPPMPTHNKPFDIYLLSQTQPEPLSLSNQPFFDYALLPYSVNNGGTGCQGGAPLAMCSSPGTECNGWWVLKKTVSVANMGTYTLEAHKQTQTPCQNKLASISVTVN